MQSMQAEIRTATFATVQAAEEQSSALKRLMDQSRVDASKTQDMLAQVCADTRVKGLVGTVVHTSSAQGEHMVVRWVKEGGMLLLTWGAC